MHFASTEKSQSKILYDSNYIPFGKGNTVETVDIRNILQRHFSFSLSGAVSIINSRSTFKIIYLLQGGNRSDPLCIFVFIAKIIDSQVNFLTMTTGTQELFIFPLYNPSVILFIIATDGWSRHRHAQRIRRGCFLLYISFCQG